MQHYTYVYCSHKMYDLVSYAFYCTFLRRQYGSKTVRKYFRTLYESTKVIPISLLIILRMKYFLKVRKYESTFVQKQYTYTYGYICTAILIKSVFSRSVCVFHFQNLFLFTSDQSFGCLCVIQTQHWRCGIDSLILRHNLYPLTVVGLIRSSVSLLYFTNLLYILAYEGKATTKVLPELRRYTYRTTRYTYSIDTFVRTLYSRTEKKIEYYLPVHVHVLHECTLYVHCIYSFLGSMTTRTRIDCTV